MAPEEEEAGAMSEDGDTMCPLCRTCYEAFLEENLITDFPDGTIMDVHTVLKDQIECTDDVSKCDNPDCPNGPRAEVFRVEARRHTHCIGGPPRDPDICECEDVRLGGMHTSALAYIHRMEKAYKELKVAKGVTVQLSTEVSTNKEVDKAQPPGRGRDILEAMADFSISVNLNNAKISTPSGYPLTVVHPTKDFHCHFEKTGSYGPANCHCTPTACSCLQCVIHHVKHAAEDYEDAVRGARLRITELQSMRRGVHLHTADPIHSQGNSGGCEMPGIRKGKHLKNYTKAKKDEYNRSW